MLSLDDIRAAAGRIAGVAHRTPILTSQTLNLMTGADVFLKAEGFQRAGAFKFRGAYNALSMLSAEERKRGVVASSSGNHAQALALAGKLLRVPVTVVMPEDAPLAKAAATEGYGAKIVRFDRYQDDRDQIQDEIARTEGRTVIPAYNYYNVMAGQGTLALEVLEDVPNLDAFLAPMSGGGLMAGCATAINALQPQVEIVGVEPAEGDDTRQSLAAGRRIEIPIPRTIADGLQAPSPGSLTFEINRRLLSGVLTATDAEIIEAMRFLLERAKILVEPSGAIALAAFLANKGRFEGKRVCVVLSGGNVDLDALAGFLECGASAPLRPGRFSGR